MTVTECGARPIAPIMHAHISANRQGPNTIVRSPSVGMLTASENVCRLVDAVLAITLRQSLERKATRVEVDCTVDHRRRLSLVVTDNGVSRALAQEFGLLLIRAIAEASGGQVDIDRTSVRLLIPLYSP